MVVKNAVMYRPNGNIQYTQIHLGYQTKAILILYSCLLFDVIRERYEKEPIMWPRYATLDWLW